VFQSVFLLVNLGGRGLLIAAVFRLSMTGG
jgi:hypothetical protein